MRAAAVVLVLAAVCLAERANYYGCFSKTSRRSIDNYRPISEFPSVSLNTCMQQCMEVFENYKIPAIIHPANNIDYYNRTSFEEQCVGAEITADQNNPNFIQLHGENGDKIVSSNDITHFRTLPNVQARTSVDEVSEVGAGAVKGLKTQLLKPNTGGKCDTSMGYYVVIGNEILLPTGADPTSMKEFHDIEQGDCAKFCSNGKGPDNREFDCNSINYYPLTKNCQLLSILAEPHGEGSLVENQDVIYAEKFCLPQNRATCESDEVFILHVEKRVTTAPVGEAISQSITSCLQGCLNHKECATAVFDSTRGRCLLHSDTIGNDESIMETTMGYVLIENGCYEKPETVSVARARGSKIYQGTLIDDSEWTEWSSCQFKVNGNMVRTRSRDCKNCEGFQFVNC